MQVLRVESVRACLPAHTYNQIPTEPVVAHGCCHLLIQKICCCYRGIVATTRLKQCVVFAGGKAVIFFCRLLPLHQNSACCNFALHQLRRPCKGISNKASECTNVRMQASAVTRLVQVNKMMENFSAAVFPEHKAQGYDASNGWCMHDMANYSPHRNGCSWLCQELSVLSVMSNLQ